MSENNCSCDNLPEIVSGCVDLVIQDYRFIYESHKCYKNGRYWGDIEEVVGAEIKVRVTNSGNRYMDGTLQTFQINALS